MSYLKLEKICIDFEVQNYRQISTSFINGIIGGKFIGKKNKNIVIRALDNINLEIKTGDRIGLVGANGAGKSTLLRTLARVFKPSEGKFTWEGKITPLLNQTPGMEMEDTGLENIEIVCMLLGMSEEEIGEKINGIVEFSGLGDFINMPIRTYSTGMLARLGFSIATSINPGILIVDEGIGAADAQFSEKAAKKVNELLNASEILILASHSQHMIEQWCEKAIWLDHGKIQMIGSVTEVFTSYNNFISIKG